MGYIFKEEGGKFIWGSDSLKVVFSSPHFQAFDDYGLVKNFRGIMHYYYDVDILQKVRKNDEVPFFSKNEDDYVWKSIANTSTYDYPNVVNLRHILKSILFKRIKDDSCQKVIADDGNRAYFTYSIDTGSLTFSDFYQIDREKCVVYGKTIITYNLYVGFPIEFEGRHSVHGIRIAGLKAKELKALYKCVDAFINYSIEKHNKEVIERNTEAMNANKIVGDKLYIFDKNGNVDKVYCVGDVADIDVLGGSLDKDFEGIDLQECTITDISGDALQIKNCWGMKKKEVDRLVKDGIPVNRILFISRDVPDELLHYNVDQVVEDWIDFMNDSEKAEFKSKSIDELNEKWKEAIANRTWMFREEHDFPWVIDTAILEKSKDDCSEFELHKKNVYEIIRIVIGKVKEKLGE